MGKLNMQLLKGIEEQENAIDKNKPDQEEVKKKPQKKDILQAVQKPDTAPGQKNTPKEDENKADAKQKKQMFSFRASLDDIAAWKAYSTVTGITVEKMGEDAMNEYLKHHKLSETDQVIFEAMKAKNIKL